MHRNLPSNVSMAYSQRVAVSGATLALTAYEKKPEFGPARLVAKEFVSKGNDLPYLVQTGSERTINGSKMRTRSRNKQSELFGRLRKGLSVK